MRVAPIILFLISAPIFFFFSKRPGRLKGRIRYSMIYSMDSEKMRSCETQLIMLVDELAKNMHKGKQTDLILLDFSKAFDKVAHEKLLLKLHQYGIRGDTLNWIKDFLDNRKQTVVINSINSDEVPVSSGILQGFVLGPILFLAYINDLPNPDSLQMTLPCTLQSVQLQKARSYKPTCHVSNNGKRCGICNLSLCHRLNCEDCLDGVMGTVLMCIFNVN